jgi:hypothetical protein
MKKIILGGYIQTKWYERIVHSASFNIEDVWASAAPLCGSFNSLSDRNKSWFKNLIHKYEI